MPLYEFRCGECQSVSEFRMKMSDPNPSICPECGAESLTKIMSAAAFHLKGGGWYSEGYDGKSNKSKKDEKADSSSSTKAEDKSPTPSSESKPKEAKPAKSTSSESKAGAT
ncbi:FmdB family zinc ribbon protein [Pseudobacteriovorax antillogorgiicola]|uniref:Putative regulatory protein, FmdB family n=1 Tax=Pseudobacteriovorax antillogorgiicola TaxID=1513793 RepID=A0A1Y6BCD7_9BACT|nr:zinc ribbon domain-containing protein [Pseudobacteriovorax antillogorgiicola]TCS58614.1 putative FmdB family regulatory protein [Pseudobacteriovorax antillogorgiicola]SME96844.1 putative regulatory protein, FmdB family [Pseudobacteriovorax antillogorgiicola]